MAAGTIVLDIETLQQDPEPYAIKSREELRPPANYKKPEAIEAWKDEQLATQVEDLRAKSSLEPLLGGTVCCVGIAVDAQEPKALLAPSGDEEGEAVLLRQLDAGLARYPDHVLVTFNGVKFDAEFLRKRAIRHGIWRLARRLFQEKPWSRTHVDLFQVWQGNDRQAMGKLRHVAAFLGLSSPDTSTGADVAALWAAGDFEAVRLHALEDVRLTREIYWRFRAAGWVVGEDPIPEDLPVRPLRPSRREALLRDLADLVVASDAALIEAACREAGIGIEDGAPLITDATTEAQIRALLTALRG